ncbi:MAG: zinc ribbon domain-containing protein, partial [Deltaproteobacteria bacterium]
DRRGKGKVQALLKGVIHCGHCDSSMYGSYTKSRGKVYRYYTCVAASKNGYDSCPVRSVSAGEIEEAVMSQLRVIFRTPEMIAQTYLATQDLIREEHADERMSADVAVTEAEVAEALRNLDGIWEELFPAEKHRIVQTLVDRVTIYENDLDVRIRAGGMHSIISEIKKSEEKKCRV